MDNSWIAVALSFVTFLGLAVKEVRDTILQRAKILADKELAVRQAEIAANTQALEDRVNRQALQIKACDSAHNITRRELVEVKDQNVGQQKQLDECREAHAKSETLERRIASLESMVSVRAPATPPRGDGHILAPKENPC